MFPFDILASLNSRGAFFFFPLQCLLQGKTTYSDENWIGKSIHHGIFQPFKKMDMTFFSSSISSEIHFLEENIFSWKAMVLKCKRITVLELVLWNSLYCFLVFNYAFENVLLENKSSCSIFQFTLLYPKAYFALSSQCCCAKKPSCGFCTITFFGIGFSSSIIFFTFTLKKSVTLLNCLHKGQSTIKRIFMSLAYKNTLNPNDILCPIRLGSFWWLNQYQDFMVFGNFVFSGVFYSWILVVFFFRISEFGIFGFSVCFLGN